MASTAGDDMQRLAAMLDAPARGEGDGREHAPAAGSMPPAAGAYPPANAVDSMLARMSAVALAAQAANDSAESEAEAGAKRRGPGRPSKLPAPPKIAMQGIVAKPKHEDSIIELGCDNPDAFKQLFMFLGKISCAQVIIHATATQLSFNAISQSEQLSVSAVVEGTLMNHYYCARDAWLNLSYSDVKEVFKRVDKSFNLITFNYRAMDALMLDIQLKDFTIQRHSQFCVNVREVAPMHNWDSVIRLFNSRGSSDIAWTLPTKAFKKTHEIAVCSSDTIDIIYHHGNTNLVLEWRGTGYANFRETYTDLKAINFRSRLGVGKILSVQYSSACGKSLSSIAPTDSVQCYCSNNKPILLTFDGPGIAIAVEMVLTPQAHNGGP